MVDTEEEEHYELLYKMIIIGDTCVGKSNILSRYIRQEFTQDTKSTVGVELGIKFLKVKNVNAKIQIWDTAGQERYRAITSSYFKGSDGCFIVYDITNEISFDNIEKWYELIQNETGKDIPVIIIGNKCDLENERKVPIEKGKEKAKNLNCPFFETSALQGINIDKAFEDLANYIYDKTGGNKNDDDAHIELTRDDNGVNLNENNEEQINTKKTCCGN